MNVPKDEIVDLLRARGLHDRAASAECGLPRLVDVDADAGLLGQYDVSVSEIVAAAESAGRHANGSFRR